jgi:hypothetical protein
LGGATKSKGDTFVAVTAAPLVVSVGGTAARVNTAERISSGHALRTTTSGFWS